MKPDDLDRLLSAEPDIEPRPAFAHSVMAAVRREAELPAPLPFPWRRVVWGVAASAAIGAAAGWVAAWTGTVPDASILRSGFDLARSQQGQAFAAVAAALLVSWLSWALPARLYGLRS